jgi:hypothetical protein
VARRATRGFRHDVRHLAFPDAGHGIAGPPGEPLTLVAEGLGGTPEGNGTARGQAWPAVLEFLSAP